jgi:hypothetical protein
MVAIISTLLVFDSNASRFRLCPVIIYLYSLFTDIYNSDEIFIDVLTLDLNAIQSNIEFGASQVQTLAAYPILICQRSQLDFSVLPEDCRLALTQY